MDLLEITPIAPTAGTPRTEPVRRIIVHCSAEPPGRATNAADIDRWHKANGWEAIGYHYVIRIDGVIEGGRGRGFIGAHVRGANRDSLGICLIGGLSAGGKPSPEYTGAQWASLTKLVRALRREYPGAAICGHNEFDSNKACPSFDVPAWYDANIIGIEYPPAESSGPLADPQALPDTLTINGERYQRVRA